MRICFIVTALVACGSDGAVGPIVDGTVETPDAPVIEPACPGELVECDATCINITNDPDHCGGCGNECTAAARCESSACTCPAPFVGGQPPVVLTTMITPPAGFVSGADVVTGLDSASHDVIVTAAVTAPLGTPLPVGGQVFVAISYELLTATQARSTYLATGGTVTLTRRCAAGIAGTLASVSASEIDPVTFVAIPGGCTTTISQLAFDIGAACP